MHLQPDSLLQGRYRVGALLAQGGMGAVYQATDERLGHTVALKQTLMHDPALRAAFEREARLLAALSHPTLPVVSDHFVEQDGQFLVMQFIPGSDLAGLLKARGTPFTPAEVEPWAMSLLAALEYLHGRQPPIIHRDIKPQNLKPAAHGGVILLDFGLAKGHTGNLATATSASLFGYTPQFAPIEQIQGSGTDARSDLYAVAATLYNLLVGTPPVDALTRVSAVVKGEADPLLPADELNSTLSSALANALKLGLSINPDQRPSSAVAMRDVLRAAFHSSSHASGASGLGDAFGGGLRPPPTPPLEPAAALGEGLRPPLEPAAALDEGLRPPLQPAAALDEGLRPPLQPATNTTQAQVRGVTPPHEPLSTRQAFMPIALFGILLVSLCVGAGFMLLATLFTPSATSVVTPPVDGPPDAAQGYSRANPLPVGTPLEFHDWRVEVLEQVRGDEAYERLRRANANNGPPREGMEYLLVNYRLTSTARESQAVPGNALRILGPRSTAYEQTANVPPEPRLPRSGDVASGGVVEGWAAYMLGQEEEQLLLVLGENSILAAPRFVALTPNASLSPLEDRSGLDPDEQGQAWRSPATTGQTVITDDWVIRIDEVLRGAAAWERISAHSRSAEPAPAGYEYVLAYVSMRYIGSEEKAQLIYQSYFTVSVGDRESESEHVSFISPEPQLRALLFPGGSTAGWIVLTSVADDPDVRIVFKSNSITFRPDGFNTRYFAIPSPWSSTFVTPSNSGGWKTS
ncbi:MAG: serine/threonine protein kinase [Candidatus Viridilinea halotolerans]|uniref:non-specific serine/threonine protein kinase n=1 Tax=Candidatus Viridilinea halotolerans TaxID=2491704 RepID=A0A426TS41_9CHLR|nr:MAG: serine/threonine protein kinase [Candidatus Viridilinea halotolerans]